MKGRLGPRRTGLFAIALLTVGLVAACGAPPQPVGVDLNDIRGLARYPLPEVATNAAPVPRVELKTAVESGRVGFEKTGDVLLTDRVKFGLESGPQRTVWLVVYDNPALTCRWKDGPFGDRPYEVAMVDDQTGTVVNQFDQACPVATPRPASTTASP
ncbi:MAG: hypothetical protein ACJ77N_08855 [Chloroflexota bacterium]|jgi:hypothetical protein